MDPERLAEMVEEQAALRRVATLVASGSSEVELGSAVSLEIGRLFGGQRSNTMRWAGDTLRIVGEWSIDETEVSEVGKVYPFGGDTITARIVAASAPARVESADDLMSEFARDRWKRLGIQASIGAPILVGGRIWGFVTASRTTQGDPFPPNAEQRLGEFAALVAQAIANADAQRSMAEVAAEQAALRRVATLVAGGRTAEEVLAEVTREAGNVFEAQEVTLVSWEGVQDEVRVVADWRDGGREPLAPGARLQLSRGDAVLSVLEDGFATRTGRVGETRPVIAAPMIIGGSLLGVLAATREPEFPEHCEDRLRSFADLAAQSIANERAQEELRASRARIVRAADEARQRLERNLHDGAQQRLVSVSIAMRFATAKLTDAPEEAWKILLAAADELSHALQELRDLARGLHPAILTDRGLSPALTALTGRSPVPVDLRNEVRDSLPAAVEAAVYYVVAESLTNVAKYAGASSVEVQLRPVDGAVFLQVIDDGVGGATLGRGSGLRGLSDRVEALDGRLEIESPPGRGTRVRVRIPLP